MNLPIEFEEYTRKLMGDDLFATLKSGLDEKPSVSIRMNPFKASALKSDYKDSLREATAFEQVPWCEEGFYLSERPNFTFDPLFHAGVYYVQEASSMFIDFIIRQLVHHPVMMLDLCAAPGGKSTCARTALPEGSILFSNEPIRTRANILAENNMKFGHPDVITTNNYPKDYKKAKIPFDVILTDVPCSGEGMFRKDAQAIEEWSPANVEKCWKLQRSIVEDVWPCLKPGGILIYSTCTFNTHEDEENAMWIADNLGAEFIELKDVKAEWEITGSLAGDIPAYRFIPGRTRGEGLFVAVLRKKGEYQSGSVKMPNEKALKSLNVISHGINPPTKKGKKEIPDISLSLTIKKDANKYPMIDVDYPTAIAYLRRESITLNADAPRGIVNICYEGQPLGFANNLGNRANNLYPQEWRIKSTHVPEEKTIVL